MAIGINWKEVWGPVWASVWTSSAGETPIGINWSPVWKQVWGPVWEQTAGGTWDFACPMPLELSGTLAFAADFEFVPALVFATDGLTLTGTLSFAADFEYTSAPSLYIPTASRVELRAIAAGSGTNVEVDFISLVGDTGTLVSVEVTCSVFSGTDADAASRLASSATIVRSKVTQPMSVGLPGVIYQLVFVGLDAQGDYHTLVGLLAVLSS